MGGGGLNSPLFQQIAFDDSPIYESSRKKQLGIFVTGWGQDWLFQPGKLACVRPRATFSGPRFLTNLALEAAIHSCMIVLQHQCHKGAHRRTKGAIGIWRQGNVSCGVSQCYHQGKNYTDSSTNNLLTLREGNESTHTQSKTVQGNLVIHLDDPPFLGEQSSTSVFTRRRRTIESSSDEHTFSRVLFSQRDGQ